MYLLGAFYAKTGLQHMKNQANEETQVLRTSELNPSIGYAKFQNGDKCSIDVSFSKDFTEKLFDYSVGKHFPRLKENV